MPRAGTTADRGYGYAHRKRTAELKAAMHDGDPCARCGPPMYRADLANIHGDHVETPMVEGGDLPDALSHGSCNTAHGARLKAARARGERGARPTELPPLPVW